MSLSLAISEIHKMASAYGTQVPFIGTTPGTVSVYRHGPRDILMSEELLNRGTESQVRKVAAHEYCLVAGTKILTPTGFVNIEDIKVGDVVISGSGLPTKVLARSKRSYSGKMKRIKAHGQFEELILTDNHPMYSCVRPKKYTSGDRCAPWEDGHELDWHEPSELSQKDYMVSPVLKGEVPASTLTWGTWMGTSHGHGRRSKNRVELTPELMRLFGYYLAEGFTQYRKHPYVLTLAFGADKYEQQYISDVDYLISKYFGVRAKIIHPKPTCTTIIVNSKEVATVFGMMGEGCANKSLPTWCMYQPPAFQEQLVKGWFLGDGSWESRDRCHNHNVVTTSEVLAEQMRMILHRMGYAPGTSTVSADHAYSDGIKRRKRYMLTITGTQRARMDKLLGGDTVGGNRTWQEMHNDGGFVYMPIQREQTFLADGVNVYNIETSSHDYMASQATVHNCHYMQHNCAMRNMKNKPVTELEAEAFALRWINGEQPQLPVIPRPGQDYQQIRSLRNLTFNFDPSFSSCGFDSTEASTGDYSLMEVIRNITGRQ